MSGYRLVNKYRGRTDWVLPAAIVVAVLAAGAVGFALFPKQEPASLGVGTEHSAVGQRPSPAELVDQQGTAINLLDLRGNVLLVNFWGTWCRPCRVELPVIYRIWEKYRGRPNFELITVSCESPGVPPGSNLPGLMQQTQAFLSEMGLADLPVYYDPKGVSRAYYYVDRSGYPTTAVVGRTGRLEGYWPGYHETMEQEVTELLDRLLGGPEKD